MLINTMLAVACCAAIIWWSFIWSHNKRRRKEKAEFVRKLKGDMTLAELQSSCERKFGVKLRIVSIDSIVDDITCEKTNYECQINSIIYQELEKLFSK